MNNQMELWLESSSDSLNLNSTANGIYLTPELDGLTGLPEIRSSTGVNAGYDGGWTSAQNYDARLIAIRGVIANPDVSQLESMRRRLATLVGQGKKETLKLKFVTEAGNVFTIFVHTMSCEMPLNRVLNQQPFLIQLRADDPLIYDDGATGGAEAILRVQQALGGFPINFELPLEIGGGPNITYVTNGGTEPVYPIIHLYGPLHSPTVINRTTNQQFQVIVDLTGADEVIIDSQLRTVTLNGTDIYHLKSPSSEFIMINPGQNGMLLTSETLSDAGTAKVMFKQGYISI